MNFVTVLVALSSVAACHADGMLRGGATSGSGWLTVSGPPMTPPPAPAVAKLDVNEIEKSAPSGGWTSGNSYLFTFRNVGDTVGVLNINPGFCGTGSCIVPSSAASTNGKFYVGPYSLDGQELAIFDTPPTLVNSWTVPASRSSALPVSSAPLDSVTITFDTETNQWQSKAPAQPFTVVQDALTSTTTKLYHGNSQSLPVPSPDAYSVAYAVSFYNNGGQISIQRAQNDPNWWAVATDCNAFAAASGHLGAMGSCSCQQYTSEQFGCPFQTSSWQ